MAWLAAALRPGLLLPACRYHLQQPSAALLMLSRVLLQSLLGLQLLEFTPTLRRVWYSGFNVVLETATFPAFEQVSAGLGLLHAPQLWPTQLTVKGIDRAGAEHNSLPPPSPG